MSGRRWVAGCLVVVGLGIGSLGVAAEGDPPASAPPVVVVDVATDGLLYGETVVDASASYDPDGEIVDISIDSDAYYIGQASGPVATFSYQLVDTYQVQVRAIDDSGQETTETTEVVIRSDAGTTGSRIPVDFSPGEIDIDATGETMVVKDNYGAGTSTSDPSPRVSLVDIGSASTIATSIISPLTDFITGVAAGPAGVFWASSHTVPSEGVVDSAVHRLDPVTAAPTQTVEFGDGVINDIEADKSAARAFVATGYQSPCRNEVTIVDAAGASAPIVVPCTATGSFANSSGADIAYDPVRDAVLVKPRFDGVAYLVDVSSWSFLAGPVPLPGLEGISYGDAIGVDPGSGRWYLSDGNTVRSYDFDGVGVIAGPVASGITHSGFAVDPSTGRVANFDGGVKILSNDLVFEDDLGQQVDIFNGVFDPSSGDLFAADYVLNRVIRHRFAVPPPDPARITLGLATIPPGDPTVFTASGALSGPLTHGDSLTAMVEPGSSSVTVDVPTGWAISGVTCDDTDSAAGAGTGEVVFATDENEDVNCVIVMTSTTADVSLTKTVDQAVVVEGGTLRYTLMASNAGPGLATDVVLSDVLPVGVTFVAAGDGCTHDGVVAGGEVTCEVGAIEAGGSAIRTIEVTARTPGTVVNAAGVSSGSTDPDPSDDTVTGVSASVTPALSNPCQTGPGNELWSFGRNVFANRASLDPGNVSHPVPVNLMRNVAQVELSTVSGLAVLDSGTVCSWGTNYTSAPVLGRPRGPSEPGFETLASPRPAPVMTPSGTLFSADIVRLGRSVAFGIVDPDGDGAGDLYGWGNTTFGQVGGTAARLTATRVLMPGGRRVVDVSSDGNVVAAITQDDRLFAWGNDAGEQLGPVPGNQTGFYRNDLTGFLSLQQGERPMRVFVLGDSRIVVVTDQGRGICYSSDPLDLRCPRQFAEFFVAPGPVIAVDAAAGSSTVAVLVDTDGDGAGDVYVSGANPGDGGIPSSGLSGLRRSAVGEPVTAVSTSDTHVLALGESGRVWGWGSSDYGSLDSGGFGTGLGNKVLFPVPLGMETADLIEAGSASSFVRGSPIDDGSRYEARTLYIPRSRSDGTDTERDGATAADRLDTTIVNSGTLAASLGQLIAFVTEAPSDPAITPSVTGFRALGEQVSISAPNMPPAPANDPFLVRFALYLTPTQRAAEELFGGFVDDMAVFRNGTAVPDCASATPPHAEDPCVRSRVYDPVTGNAVLTVATTRFSTWTFAAPAPVVDAGGPYSVVEGSSVQLDGSATGVPANGRTIEWDVSNGELDDSARLDPVFTGVDDGEFTASLSVTAAEATGIDLADVTVTNASPVIGSVVASPSGAAVGSPVSLGVEFTDPGVVDTHTVSVDWGDGTAADARPVQSFGGDTVDIEHTYAVAGSYRVTVTVTDDDGGSDTSTTTIEATAEDLPAVSVGDQSGLERDSVTGSVFVPVTLSEPADEPVVVLFHTQGGSATSGVDYSRWGTPLLPRSVTIPAGSLQTTINVPVLADSLVEDDESFSVVLSSVSGSGAVIGDGTGVATIVDADGVSVDNPAVAVSSGSVVEGDDGRRRVQFQVHLSRAPASNVTISYATVDGSAVAPGDFVAKLPGSVVFAPGQISKTIDVLVNSDRVAGGDREFWLEVSVTGGSPVEELDMVGVARIIDDD
jgi:uncharacterized repeat protein (TIGR01451 family)